MLKPKAFANAITTVWAVAYIACFVLTLIAPDLVFGVVQSWAHSLNINTIRSTEPMDLGSSLIGQLLLEHMFG